VKIEFWLNVVFGKSLSVKEDEVCIRLYILINRNVFMVVKYPCFLVFFFKASLCTKDPRKVETEHCLCGVCFLCFWDFLIKNTQQGSTKEDALNHINAMISDVIKELNWEFL